MRYRSEPASLNIERIVAQEPYARVVISREQILNISAVFDPEGAAAQRAAFLAAEQGEAVPERKETRAERRRREKAEKAEKQVSVTSKNLDKFLGVRRFRYGKAEEENRVGHVTGLAWTEVGGELLTIEAAVVPGKGKLQHTGQLGEVMQESIQAAMTVVRSRANVLGIDPDFYQKHDVHLHMPEGATPKDGPSAGIGMCTALVSALTKIPVRSDVAMTGEITLRGEVLPIGGLKEKLLAAHRGGITTVMIPVDNEKDLTEIPDNIKGKLDIRPVKWIDEVFEIALAGRPAPRLATPPPAEEKRPRRAGRRSAKEVQAH